jgi:hypothetical protein
MCLDYSRRKTERTSDRGINAYNECTAVRAVVKHDIKEPTTQCLEKRGGSVLVATKPQGVQDQDSESPEYEKPTEYRFYAQDR